MLAQENKNLLVTYLITLGVSVFLIVVIVNFNGWFFPNDELKLSEFTPASRGVISERDLRFSLFSDQKFGSLQPILSSEQLAQPSIDTSSEPTVSGTAKPSVRPQLELRHGNPFSPF